MGRDAGCWKKSPECITGWEQCHTHSPPVGCAGTRCLHGLALVLAPRQRVVCSLCTPAGSPGTPVHSQALLRLLFHHPHTHVHTPHSPEGPNHLFIKMLCIPDPKHKPAMPAGGLGKVKGVKSPNPRHQHVPIKAHEFMSNLEKVSGMKRSVFCFTALCFLCCPNKV